VTPITDMPLSLAPRGWWKTARAWPEDRETYYGAFVRNPDGNNVEAVCRLPE
jgi:hypothetical protein